MVNPDDLLDDLTPAQRDAVTHSEGPLLILAAAGSGKTRVITRRIAWLLAQGVRPWSILAITFTNKAAGEMKRRVEELVPGNRVLISTFHSLGARLLRQYADRLGLDKNFTIYDQDDRVKLVKLAKEDARIDDRVSPEAIQAAISKAKNELLSPDRYAKHAGYDYFSQLVANVYPGYEKRLRAANALDFDDLLYWPALALQHNAELRAELDNRFRYVLIDEYQDTNQAQYAIARGLSLDYPNLCVVGDPDQNIYTWRSADIRNILSFERDFPGARVITLSRNYRSTKAILSAADGLIRHNKHRKPKDLLTENPDGVPVRVLTFENGHAEAEGIAQRIRAGVDQGRRYRDFAVFVRVNALTRGFEQAFIQQRIPYQIVRGLAFFDRKENRDVIAYLRLLVNPRDELSFQRVVNEPVRGIGKVSLAHLEAYAAPRELPLLVAAGQVDQIKEIKGKAALGLRQFAALMRDLATLLEEPPDEIIRALLDRSGYRLMLLESTNDVDRERLANVEEFITAAQQFHDEDPSRTLADFLESITLVSDVDAWDEKQDCVSVMTLHAAKGLEFPVVFLTALEQGILPHERSLKHKDEDLEEERRLTFVGMTRAKEELVLTSSKMREYRGQTLYTIPSMFLKELPDDVERIDLAGTLRHALTADRYRNGADEEAWAAAGIGQRRKHEPMQGQIVRHGKYGLGQVLDLGGHGIMRKIRIRFQKHGERTFLLHHEQLEVIDD